MPASAFRPRLVRGPLRSAREAAAPGAARPGSGRRRGPRADGRDRPQLRRSVRAVGRLPANAEAAVRSGDGDLGNDRSAWGRRGRAYGGAACRGRADFRRPRGESRGAGGAGLPAAGRRRPGRSRRHAGRLPDGLVRVPSSADLGRGSRRGHGCGRRRGNGSPSDPAGARGEDARPRRVGSEGPALSRAGGRVGRGVLRGGRAPRPRLRRPRGRRARCGGRPALREALAAAGRRGPLRPLWLRRRFGRGRSRQVDRGAGALRRWASSRPTA